MRSKRPLVCRICSVICSAMPSSRPMRRSWSWAWVTGFGHGVSFGGCEPLNRKRRPERPAQPRGVCRVSIRSPHQSKGRPRTRWVAMCMDKFQSLFFWIHFYNHAFLPLCNAFLPSFNPCFSGFTSTTTPSFRSATPSFRVSILVFLDSLLQPRLPSALQRLPSEFQSLFFWIHFYNSADSL